MRHLAIAILAVLVVFTGCSLETPTVTATAATDTSAGEHTAALAALKGHDLFGQTVALFRNDGHLYRDCGNLTIAFTRTGAAARAAELNQLLQDCAQRNAAQ